jgi:(p)ppGpp synthase/HD superfamily hydrolase
MNEKDHILEQIHGFAARAHQGQFRKYPHEPYIHHPERVMEICAHCTKDLSILGAALLHDILEDTTTTKEQLTSYLNTLLEPGERDKMIQLIDEMTDIYTKDKYPHLNRDKRKALESERIRQTSGDSQTIRYADIIDNCTGLENQDPEFAQTFLCECQHLLKVINKGSPQLYIQAELIVNETLKRLENTKPL